MEYNKNSYNKRMRSDIDNMGGPHSQGPRPYSMNRPPPYGGNPQNGPQGYDVPYHDYEPQKRRKMEHEVPHHIILVTVINPTYPITVDVLKTICDPYANVVRIVIFKKNGVQAMIEFENIEAATRTKDGLQGADIYSECCTLRIEYAKTDKLNVFVNDGSSWDFQSPNMGYHPDQPGRDTSRPSLLQQPQFGMNSRGRSDRYGNDMGGEEHRSSGQGSVLMVYGLPTDNMNADKLFNLLCLYGNVVRVKFLKTKEGCAMVQMGDSCAVERCIENLNYVHFIKNKLQLRYSKQEFLADVQTPYDLPDGTPSYKDYMGNINNRFMNPKMAAKNRIQPPSKILHFWNTPPTVSDKEIEDKFTDGGVMKPKSTKVFPSRTDRSSSGLLEFSSIGEALEALVHVNHAAIPNEKGNFIMKLCFSRHSSSNPNY